MTLLKPPAGAVRSEADEPAEACEVGVLERGKAGDVGLVMQGVEDGGLLTVSAGVDADLPPYSFTQSVARAAVRLNTVTSWPARFRCPAIG